MDVQRPIPRQKLRADWGAAVSDELRSQRLEGPGVLRTPCGTSLAPAALPGPARAEPPPERFAAWFADGGDGLVVRVRKGAVRGADGAALAYSASDFEDAGDWWEAPAPDGAAEIAAEGDGEGGWTLRLGGGESAPEWRVPLAAVEAGEGVRRVLQLRTGDITLDLSGDHWGETEPLVELPADGGGEWRAMKEAGAGGEPSAVAESALVDIELDDEGRVTARHYRTRTIDAKGNVVAISDRAEDNADPDPGAPDAGGDTPPCGHPLNADDDYHPLAGSPKDGGSAAQDDDDSHPLDHEGPGGYTPNCKG